MLENPYYSQATHGPYELYDLGDLLLEEGGTLRNCSIAYATFGSLNSEKSNAILIPTWFSGTSKIMEQAYVGVGRAIDPEKYFIIIVNQIGSGLSTSPHNTSGPGGRASFPHVRISDDVRAQHKLVTEKFGIEKLALVFGASMGAQQTYEWAVRYPDMVARAAPVAGTAKNSDHCFIFTQTLIDALESDPAFEGGWYRSAEDVRRGLHRHAGLWAVMGWCTEFYSQQLWRDIAFSSYEDFLVNFMDGYFGPMDPNNLLCMAWKWQRGDVSRAFGGDIASALGRITAKTFVMPVTTDLVFPVAECETEQRLIAGSELRPIKSNCGHFGLIGIEQSFSQQIDANLNELLSL